MKKKTKTIKEMMEIVKHKWPEYSKKVDKKVVKNLYNKAKQLKW